MGEKDAEIFTGDLYTYLAVRETTAYVNNSLEMCFVRRRIYRRCK